MTHFSIFALQKAIIAWGVDAIDRASRSVLLNLIDNQYMPIFELNIKLRKEMKYRQFKEYESILLVA